MSVVDFSSLVESVSSYSKKALLIRMIAHGLVKAGNVDGAVKIVSAFPDAAWRLELLLELSLFLADTDDCESALRLLKSVKDEDVVLEALLEVWDFERVEEVLKDFGINGERVKRAVRKFGNYQLFDWFSFLVEAGRVDEALEAVRGFEEDHYRLRGLITVMGALAKVGDESYKEVLDEVSDAADSLSDYDYDNVMANTAVELASVEKGETALNMAYEIDDDYTFVSTLIDCLPYFEGKLFENTFNEILDVADELPEEERGDLLIDLFCAVLDLPETNKPLFERIIRSVSIESIQGLMQICYAQRLSENGDETFKEFYREGMKTLRKTTGETRFHVARALVEFIPKGFTDELIKFIKEIPDVKEQSLLLSELSVSKSSTEETEDALKIARSITMREEKSAALYQLACATHDEDFEHALNTANEIPDRSWRERAFSYLFASALGKGEFRQDLFGKVMAGLTNRDEEGALLILTPMVISLATAGRKELEDVVNQISKLDYLNTLRKALPLLMAGNVEEALKVAREGSSGLVKTLLLSSIAVRSFQKSTSSPRKILDEARREVKRIEDEYMRSYALTIISFALAVTTRVKNALEILLDEPLTEYSKEALFEVLVRLSSTRHVDDLIKVVQSFKTEHKLLIVVRIIAYIYLKGYRSVLDKVLDTLISYDPSTIPHLINMFEDFEAPEFIQKLIEKHEDKTQGFSFLGSTYAFKGEVEQAKGAFQKALEELSKIPPDDDLRFDNLYLVVTYMIMAADESYLDFAKKFLQEDEFELLSQLFKASNYASKEKLEKVREIFQSIKSKHLLNDIFFPMVIVAGRMKDKNSLILLKEIFETEEAEALSNFEISYAFIQFIRVGGDIKTAVKFIEKNWAENKDLLHKIAQYFFVTEKIDKFKKLVENMSYHNKASTINTITSMIAVHNPEELAELAEDVPVYTKDKVLAIIAEEYMRNGKIEEALSTVSKIALGGNYNQALKNMFLTLLEKLARE
ncbi:MAG: hypothetical protein ACUVXA_15740 [Candidatus Jordarchaeum sp.]|uniref:hypothetical protein n=1 Tax=Candidatus Jordarchaeum sp. TaxID=2823881 RepID=UPI004049A693